MLRFAPSLAVALASLIVLWAAPSLAEKIGRPESFVSSSSVCGTGQKLARQAYRVAANISLAMGFACAAAFAVASRRLGLVHRCLCETAIILALTHGFLAYFGSTLAHAY